MTAEKAAGERLGPFPAEWGIPPGSQFSDERAAWIRRMVTGQRDLTSAQVRIRNMRRQLELHRRAVFW